MIHTEPGVEWVRHGDAPPLSRGRQYANIPIHTMPSLSMTKAELLIIISSLPDHTKILASGLRQLLLTSDDAPGESALVVTFERAIVAKPKEK